jgi:hypothetical protein
VGDSLGKVLGTARSALVPTRARPIFVGVDVGVKHDAAAVVAVSWDEGNKKLVLANDRIWRPSPTEPLDLEATVEARLREGPGVPRRRAAIRTRADPIA